MAPHSSTLAWKIPWTEEPGRLQSMGSLRVGHDWAPSLSLFTFMHWRRKWQPTPVFLPGESQGRGSQGAAVYGVAQSQTRLKRLSSSCSSIRSIPFLSFIVPLFARNVPLVFLIFFCSQRWRSSIQPAKRRPGADCGSNHELLITKFRLKLKKV